MNNGNTPAMPQSGDAYTDISGYKDIPGRIENGMGLSKREQFAAMAMTGLVTHDRFCTEETNTMAAWAVECADALLSQLEKAK
tara:strand:- start:3319 stop:3567 length:249 start_codon:yes stop_codon:yes gene_type:complete